MEVGQNSQDPCSSIPKRPRLVDRSKIIELSSEETSGLPSVTAYSQEEFESGIISQVTNAYEAENNREIADLRVRLHSLRDDLTSSKSDLHKMEVELNNLLMVHDFSTKSGAAENRKIRNLELAIETKMKQIDTLNAREQSLTSKLMVLQRINLQNPTNESVTQIDVEQPPLPEVKPPIQRASVLACEEHKIQRSINRESGLLQSIERLRKTSHIDDADCKQFQCRLQRSRKVAVLSKELDRLQGKQASNSGDGMLDGDFHVPSDIWDKLYDYQKTGIRWLLQLHRRKVGGIVGDEMGLGKTIQIIGFLAGLHHSELRQQGALDSTRPEHPLTVLIVCPATILRQWMDEFHQWYPPIRVLVLHQTGSRYHKPNDLLRSMSRYSGSVLLTTYNTLVAFQDMLVSPELVWSYVILDEGHKIKNPDAEVTNAVKRFSTPHRIILSGSPIQNNLKELWSVFDFVCPGRLGPLPDFMQQFAIPITQGGYSTASPLQVETAYRCACTLRDILSPYLIRRLKAEVRLQLPKKSEQVLFCRLTNYQKKLYQEFLESQMCKELLHGKGNVFSALILLRKLCNHPDLVTGGPRERVYLGDPVPEDDYVQNTSVPGLGWNRFGCPHRSSKMLVVLSLLQTWIGQKHKILVFSQSRRMLNLLERMVIASNFTYVRMDGSTPVGQRSVLIDQFNRPDPTQPNVSIFLLTTRVGGLGINLTAASRVLIYDPDWNPTTDLQARERAWRIGQQQNVVIYRLLTSGTIEEKIYQRQIFKQFLTNRILKNPRQQRFFKTNDLQELLSFDDVADCGGSFVPETADYVNSEGLGHTVHQLSSRAAVNRFDLLMQKKTTVVSSSSSQESDFEADDPEKTESSGADSLGHLNRQQQLRLLARDLSRRIAEGRLDDGESMQSQIERSRKHSSRPRSKLKGVRVDGRRIALISRRSRHDSGDAAESVSKPVTTVDSDPFVASLLTRASESYITDSTKAASSLDHVNARRASLDPDLKSEAIRVAQNAFENLMQSSKTCALTPGPSTRVSTSKKTHRKKTASSNKSSSSSVNGLSHVSHVLSHDKLLDELTNVDRVDSSFPTLDAHRLAVCSITALCMDVEHPRPRHSAPVTEVRFGLLKNRFLWNPDELQSNAYVSFIQSLKQSAFSTPSALFDHTVSLTSTLPTTPKHGRFSSAVLLDLVRKRRALRQLDSSGSSTTCFDPQSVQSMQRLAIDLLRLFAGSNCVTSDLLAVEFRTLLSSDARRTAYGSLDSRHFRAMLRVLAKRSRPVAIDGDCATTRADDQWTLRERYRSLSHSVCEQLMPCERD